MNRQSILITNTEDFNEMLEDLAQYDVLAVDTETDGTHYHRQPVGISLAGTQYTGYYIPLQVWSVVGLKTPWKLEALNNIKDSIKDLLLSKKLVLHNAVFDIKVFENWHNFSILDNIHCDTMLLAHTVYNEDGPLGLKPLAAALIDPEAANPQSDVKESVLMNGGEATKKNFEMWKCDYKILGRYACFDAMYCLALYEKLYPEIDKQDLRDLWENEVHALLPVTYELNNTGVKVDLEHFTRIKEEAEKTIESIESEIKALVKEAAEPYEFNKTLDKLKLTPRSQIGKHLISLGLNLTTPEEGVVFNTDDPATKKAITEWAKANDKWCELNLDSGDDKAFLLYQILELPCEEYTDSGKPATDGDTLEDLCTRFQDKSPVLKGLLKRSAERKMLNSYIIPILEKHTEGRIYTGFNQTATISGRFSSSKPINLQTLIRDDKRVKQGFIPDEGMSFVAMDYESAEPKVFAHVSGDYRLQDIFKRGHDFYSTIAIATEGLNQYSADPEAENYLGKCAKSLRQKSKAYSLGICYGLAAYKLSQSLSIDVKEAQILIDNYLNSYPDLHQWMLDSEEMAITHGYVVSLMGRKRRLPLVKELHDRFRVTEFTRQNLCFLWKKFNKIKLFNQFEKAGDFAYACKNELNNAKNFQIQSMAASICNRAMIKFYREAKRLKLNAKIMLQIHDEIVILCPNHQAKDVAILLKECMLNNSATENLTVPMAGEPIITTKNLAEAK